MSMIKVPTWKFKSWNYMRSQSGKLRHAQGPTTALLRVSSSLSFSFPQRFHLWHHQHQQQQHWHQKSSTRVSIRGASFSAADHLSPKLDKLGVRKIGLHTLLLLLRSRVETHTHWNLFPCIPLYGDSLTRISMAKLFCHPAA